MNTRKTQLTNFWLKIRNICGVIGFIGILLMSCMADSDSIAFVVSGFSVCFVFVFITFLVERYIVNLNRDNVYFSTIFLWTAKEKSYNDIDM